MLHLYILFFVDQTPYLSLKILYSNFLHTLLDSHSGHWRKTNTYGYNSIKPNSWLLAMDVCENISGVYSITLCGSSIWPTSDIQDIHSWKVMIWHAKRNDGNWNLQMSTMVQYIYGQFFVLSLGLERTVQILLNVPSGAFLLVNKVSA